MEVNWIIVLYALLVIDSVGAIIVSWFGRKWWINLSNPFVKHFPPAKGWSALYFLLVVVIGHLLGLF